uniref:Uncharacterized protein n=1 Tax=Oryza rufipogon TaxID=4529 RepID=A0A0E0PYU9_ORYRU
MRIFILGYNQPTIDPIFLDLIPSTSTLFFPDRARGREHGRRLAAAASSSGGVWGETGGDSGASTVAHDGIGQRRMRKEEAATHGGGCVDLLHCAMHEEGGGSGFPIRAHTFPKFSLRSNINLLHGAVWTVEDEAVLPGRWSGGRKASAQLFSQNQ